MEQDDRSQKLLAGKEKLAAFQRKRAKRKKKKEDDGASEYTWSETSSMADLSDVASTGDFSDTGSVVDEENDWSRPVSKPQVSQSVALVRAQNDVRKMTSRITELEEMLHGKQEAMSRLMEENKQLQASQALPTQSTADLPMSAPGSLDDQGGSTDDRETDEQNADETYQHKLDEFEEALKKRDEVIAQLTENLRATTVSRDTLQHEYTAQASELARQVQTLQMQLKQSGECLKNQMGEHGISAHALLEAKNELLALQQANSHQEQDLTAARAAISERDQALHKLIEQYKAAAEQANLIHQEYGRLQQQNTQNAQLIEQLTHAREEVQSEKLATLQQCQELQNKAADADLQSQQLSQQLKDNQLRIETFETALNEGNVEICRLKEVVEQKDESLKQMVQSLTSVSNDQDADKILHDTVDQQQNEISSLKEAVHHKDQKLHQLNEKFFETSEQLKTLYTEVAALKEKEKEVTILRQTIHEREETVSTLQNNIQAKEQNLLALQQSLIEQQNGNKEEFSEEINENTVADLKEQLIEKDKLLQDVSERFRALAEKSGKLEEDSAKVLLVKLQQLTQDNATLLEENKQLKETENEINEIAAKIPQLSHEIQRLGGENRELKQKENEMYQLIEDMKKREQIVDTLNNEKQQLAAAEEALQKENQDLKDKLISLKNVKENLNEIQSKYSELQQKIDTLESERDSLKDNADVLKMENVLLKEKSESLSAEVADIEQLKLEQDELLQRAEAADKDRETTAVKLADLQDAYDKVILASEKKDEEKKMLVSQVAELEQELKIVKLDVEAHQRSASDRTESEVIQQQAESLREVVKEKEAALDNLTETVTKLTAEVKSLSDENQQLVEQNGQIEQLQVQVESSNGELSNLRASLEQKEAMLEDTRNSVNNLEMQVSVLNDENKEMKEKQNELRHLKDLVAAKEKEIIDLGKCISEKDRMMDEMSVVIDDFKKTSARLESTIAEKEKATEELQDVLNANKSKLADLSSEVIDATEKVSQLQLENKGLQQQIETEKVKMIAASEKDNLITGLKESLQLKQVELESLHNKLSQSELDKAEIEAASASLNAQLTDLRHQVDELNHNNQDLMSQLSCKEDLNGQLEETIKEKQANLTELEEKVGSLTEELQRTQIECKNLQNEAHEKEVQMTALKKDLSDYETKVDKHETENALLQEEVESLKENTEKLQEKEDVLVKTEGEVTILKETLKERDERLMELTDSMTKLTQDLSQLTGMNHILQVREDELLEAQRNVQQHIDAVNEQIETLKAENQALAAKEQQLLESQTQLCKAETLLAEANEKFATLQKDYDTMMGTHSEILNREDECVALKEEVQKLTLNMEQLNEENNDLRSKIEIREQQDEVAEGQENMVVPVKAQNVTATQQTIPDHSEVSSSVDISTHEDDLGTKATLAETQLQLEKLHAENQELKKSLDGLLSSQKIDVTVSKDASGDSQSDITDVVGVAKNVIVTQTVPDNESPQDLAPAVEETGPAVPGDRSEEADLLRVALDLKEEEARVLQSSIQTQHAALQQMHQQLTEVTQYVTYLSHENQALKAKLSPETQEATNPTTDTQSETQTQLQVPKVDSAQIEDLSGKSTEKSTVEMLQSQIDQQREALEDMSERYSKLVEENHAMKLEISRKDVKVEPPTVSSVNTTEHPQTTAEVPENKEVVTLHAYIQQQNAHMEQMSQRMNEMAQYVTQVQEQNKLLQEKDEMNGKALETQVQASEETEKQRKQLEEQLQKENELKDSLESNSASLAKLDQENKLLKQKEKESTEVVQQLMKDIEEIRRSRSQSPSHSDVVTLGGSVSAAEHERALAALRAELEEQHGEQIVEMKQQYREQIMTNMNEQIKDMTRQRDDALEQLTIKEKSSSEEVESLNSVIQQCELKLRNMEDERAEYLLKLQEQQDRFSEELAAVGKERDSSKALLAEYQLEKEKIANEFEQFKEEQAKGVDLLHQRLAEVISERDQVIVDIEKLKTEEPSESTSHEESNRESSAREQHVQEMAKQLQDLARERDEALAKIQAQEQSLNQPLQQNQHNVQSQVVDALKTEIDALNLQLNDVTSAKEEALTHVEKLQKAIDRQAEEPSGSSQQGSHQKSNVQTTPVRRKLSPKQKPLSPMQQQLLHLQQQLLQDSPPAPENLQHEAAVEDTSPPTTVSSPTPHANTEQQSADKTDLQLKQMQEIYDQHCQLQAHQIEQLTAELARVGREREELMSQLEQYQKHYDSHVQNLVEQGKKEAADKVKAIHEQLNEAKKERDMVSEKFEALQSQTKSQIRELTEQVAGWKGKYHEMSQSFTGDSAVVLARVQAETSSLQSQIADLQAKLEASEKEKDDAKAQAKELKIAYYDLEGKDPNVAGYRQKLEDIEATLKVTWIENEELKVEVASLKSKLQKEDGTAEKADTDKEVVEDVDSLKARLSAAEAEVDRLQPLVGVEVIVLMRQMEDLRSTFSHQLRVHAQELTAVKCELARYQSLDSDSSESPVRTFTELSPDKKHLEKPSSVDSTNIELGRAHAEHQLEVESLKKSKGEFALELNAEKERHRDAMARIEQLLKEMVNMQQKHKEEMEAVRKDHEETVHQMSVRMEEMKLQQMVNTNTGADDVSEMKVHFDTIINEKQRLLTERDQLLQEKGDWDAERDRLKGRIAQVVGEKDLIAKERDTIRDSIQKVEQDQNELRTQQRLVEAEKQQLMFERDQMNFLNEQSNAGTAGVPTSDNDQIKSLQAELAALNKYKEQVALLQQERSLLVNDHMLETKTLTAENIELKQRLEQAESEKQQELEELQERMAFDINELQVKLEMVEQEQPSSHQQELSILHAENEQLIKEYSTRAVTQMAEWKLQREDMEKEFEVKLESHTKEVEEQFSSEISDLKTSLRDAAQEAEQVKKERDALKAEHTDVVEALRAQESELVKLQTACSHLKEERDVLQSEYSGMLTSLQQEAADSRIPHLTSQVQHLTAQRQAMQNEHTLALSALKDEYDADQARLQHLVDEANTKHTEHLHTCSSSHEAELEVYKQKHAEVLEEVRTLRRENYEMRTVVSDPRTQQNMTEVVACTTQMLTKSPPGVHPDSLSPDTTTASEEERDFHKIKDEYQSKLKALEDEHEKELKDKEASLQERCELSQRQLKVEYQWDLQEQAKTLKEEAARETDRQLKVARIENERKFVTELQAARREISGRYESQLEMLRQQYEEEDLHQATLTTNQLQDIVTRLQIENKDLAETRDALLQQIDKAHGHQEELQEEVTAVSTQKDALSAENLQLQHRLTQVQHNTTHMEPNWHPLPDSTVTFIKPPSDNTESTHHQQLLEKYSMLLGENQKLQQRLAEQQPKSKSPSIPDSLEGSLEPPDLMMRLQDQIRGLQKENDDLRSHLDDQNLVAHEELGELQGKYIQLVAENESLRANLDKYEPHDLLDEDIDITAAERRETDRLRSCYSTLAQENEVLRAKLGSYGLPTESAAEEENLDLASRYELIRKENEGLRAKLQAYTHQGALERDGRWKEKYDTILRDYAILRSQLEELGLPINDSIQKGLEELQVKFDQVVKEKETLQVKLTTVRENAEQDFRELQARHSELHATNTALSKEHADLKALLEKDKDKSKREYLKTKSKLLNTSKELEALRSKFEKATKDSNALKLRLDQAEARLKQEASSSAAGNAGKGKKRKQERGNHSKGRKQRRESEAQDDSVEMADQTIQEELDSLNNQYMSVVKENDALKSEVGGLKCELGSLKSRLMDSLRHRLRDPPVAHSTPLDSDFTHSQGNQDSLASTPTGRPMAGRSQQAEGSSSTPDLNLSSPEDVEALRQQHEAALQELGRLRNELDRMNSRALDELMGLQSEADALEAENASMKQTLKTDGAENTDPLSQVDVLDAAHHTQTNVQLQQQLRTVREQLDEVKSENEELRQIIGNAAGMSEQGNVKKDSSLIKKRGNASNLTHRNVQSESEIHPVKENTEMATVSDQVLQKQKSKRTLESLRTQYEAQVQALRAELEQERKSQGRANRGDGIYTTDLTADVTSDVTSKVMTSTDRDLAQAEAALREHLLSQLRVELEDSHRDEVSGLQQALSQSVAGCAELQKQITSFQERLEEQQDIIGRQRDQIMKQNAVIEEQKKQFESELTLQMQAQRITLEGVNKSKQTLLQNDIRKQHQDEIKQLQDQIANNKINQQQFEDEKRNAIEQIRKELQERFTTDLVQCQSKCEGDKVIALQQLRSDLEIQYRHDLSEVRVQLDAEKEEASSNLCSDLEEQHRHDLSELQVRLDAEKQEALITLRSDLDEQYRRDLSELQVRLDAEKEEALSTLRSDLDEQYRRDLSELQVRLDAEKDEALTKLHSVHEEAKSATLQSQLDDIEAKHAKALEDLHDELNVQHHKEIADLRAELEEENSELVEALKEGNTESLRALRELLEEGKTAELDSLRTNLEVENDRQLLNLRSMLEQEKTEELQNLQEELDSKKEEEIKNLRNALDTAVAEVEEIRQGLVHEKELALQELEEQHESHVSQLTDEWEQKQQEESKIATSKEIQEQEKILEDMKQQFTDEKAKAELEHQAAMDSLRAEHNTEITTMKDKHEKDLLQLVTSQQTPGVKTNGAGGAGEATQGEKEQNLEEEYIQLRVEERGVVRSHEQLLHHLKQEHLNQLDTVKYAVKEELLAENMRKLEEMTGDLKHSHQAEMDELRKELDKKYQDQIHFLEEELERSNDDAEKALREMRDKYEREIQTLRDTSRQHDGVGDPGGGGLQQDGLARLTQQHEGELQELEQEHQQKLAVVEKFHAEALDKQKREAEQKLASELERLHQQLEDEKQEEVRRVKDSLEEQISDLKHQLGEAKQDMPDGTEEELTRRMDQIGRLSELLSERGEDLSKSQENIALLEKQLKDNKEDYELLSARWQAMEEGDLNRDRLMQADLEQATRERDGLQQANNRLLQILSETVNTNLVAEERINRQLARLVAEGGRLSSASGSHRESGVGGDSDLPSSSAKGGEEETLETSAISVFSDEGLDLSQRINESVFAGPELDPDGEEIIMDAGSRLQQAVERLLDMFVSTTRQLHDAQSTQRDLVSSLTSRAEEAQNLGVQVDDLQQRLREESDAKAFLAVELNKAEGLLQGYSDEKRQLEDAVAVLEEKKEELIIDLEHAQSQLRQIAEVEDEITARETALERQQHTLEQSLNEEDQVETVQVTNESVLMEAGLAQSPTLAKDAQGLLHEVQKVLEEKRDVQRQADKDREIFEARTEELEQMVEEQQMTYEEQLEQKKAELDDLMHKLEDMEKKSKSNNLFLEEQTMEREQEREEFQREVLRLKALVKDKEKSENAENRLQREESPTNSVVPRERLAELEDQLSERTTLHNQTLLKKEELERELANQEANVRTLQEMIRQLEEELEAKTLEEQQVREKLEKLEADLARQQEVSQELTGELKKSIPQDELKRLVSDLESQLETIQKSEKLASQKVHQKDEELRNMKTMEEELLHDKTSLQDQVHSQLTELSTLRTQMEEMKLSAARHNHDAQTQAHLRELLAQEQEALQQKSREIEAVELQLDAVRRELLDKTELVQQLEAQLEVSEKERRHQLAESTRRTSQLHDEKAALQAEIRSLREKVDSTPMPVLTQALLDEKNQEIDDLTEQLIRLQQQLNDSTTQQEVERLTKEVEERRTEVKAQGETIEDLEDEITKMKEDADLMSAIKDADAEKDRKLMAKIQEKEDRIHVLEQEVSQREEDLTHLETQTTQHVKQLQEQLQQKDSDMVKMMEDYEAQRESDLNSLQDTIREREATIDDMSVQVDSLQHEITGLRDFQAKLQEDFDTVQNMLEQKQREIEVLTREMTPQTDNVSELKRYEAEVLTLQKEVRVKQATIEEREEQLYTLQEQAEQVEVLQRDVEDLREALDVKERLLVESQDENRTLEDRLRLLEADNSDDAKMRLHQQIQAQETLIEQLQDELSLSQSNLKARQDEFNRALSELEQQQQVVPQMVQTVAAAPRPHENMEHLREQLRQEYEQRLNHKILELESSHKHQVEALREQFDVERRTLREETRREMEKRHSEELNQLVLQHQEELSRLRHAIDLSDDDSIIEAGRRLQAEIERGERIDSRVYHPYPGRQPSSPGPEQDSDTRLMHIINNIEAQGVRILSLSEMETLRRHVQQTTGASNTSALQQAWEAEKHALLASVQSLKDLLAQTQHATGARDDDSGADWRADLLRAICYVFAKERDGLLAELRTHVVTHGRQDAAAVHQLEQHIKEMDVQHRSAMKQIFSADRQSMLAELRDLRAHLSVLRLEKQDERGKLAEQLGAMEEQFTKQERQLRRQLELMEYKIQQEKVMADDLRSSLEIEKSRTMELSSQLSREKNSTADLQGDLVDSQTQLAKLKDAFEREQARLVSASSALEEERAKSAELTEALTIEQMSASQVTEQLKSEQLRNKQHHERSKQLTEKLRREVETERERYGEATTAVERERMTSSSLRRELDLNREQLRTSESKFKVKVAELKSSVEVEKARNDELNTALQRERQLVAALRDSLEEERGSKDDLSAREQAAISDLQAMLDAERSKLLDLQMTVERERRKVSSLNSQLDQEQTKAQESLELERATCRQLKVSLESLQTQKSEVSQQLVFVQEKATALEEDRNRLHQSLRAAQQQAHHLEAASNTSRITQHRLQEEADNDRQRQHDADAEITRLRQKAAELQMQLLDSQRAERSAREQLELQQLSMSPPTDLVDGHTDKMEFYKRQLETLRQRLHTIVNRHQEELTRMLRTQFGSAGSSTESLDGSSRPELESIAGILRNILSELQQVHGVIVHDSDTASHTSPKREEFLSASYYRMEVEAAEDRLASERVSWLEERGAFTLKLHNAEKEINNIKNKLRKTEIQLEREREKYITPVPTAGSVDKEKMQRLYGKYLRAESFRKALVYQKKYLLLLLGGFQDCEEQTLSEIAKMGVYPAAEDVMRRTRHPRPYSRFRSAVRVVIAVSRMKYLVKKWQRASRVGSPAVTGLQNGTGSYVPPTGGFAQPRRHYPATSQLTNGVLTGAVGGSVPYTRSATPGGYLHSTPPTRDISAEIAAARSPNRSVLSTGSARRQLLNDEDGGDAASQDSSLDDYISRLEHIQVRLSTVNPSTSPTYFVR